MALQHSRSPAVRAAHATLVDEAARGARRATHLDLVLATGRRLARVEAAALADAEKQVVVVSVLRDEGTLLGVRAFRLVRDARGRRTRGDGQRRVVHLDRVDVAPEGAEGHDDVGAVVVGGGVDGVVGAAGLGGDARRAVVSPGVEVGGRGDADGRGLGAEGRDGVEEVVGVAELGHVGGLRCAISMCLSLGERCVYPTQRSSLPVRLIFEPAGMAAPRYVQGPLIVCAEWMAIFPPVEKR